MTLEEFNDKFDDEHQNKFYASQFLDEERRSQLLPEDQTWEQQRKIMGFE